VKGGASGQWRTTPVNLLSHDHHRYLVAPRGETQWVRNLRAVGTGELRVGPDSSDEQTRAIAPKHPAFEVLPVS